MGRGLGQLAGIFALALALGRLGRLMQSGPGVPEWRLILIASTVLGGVVWWLLRQLFTSRLASLVVFVMTGLILFLRVSVPKTLIAGILPSMDTPSALAVEMEQALRLIRTGIPPIVPTEGVIAILAGLVWVVAALYVWGMVSGPVAAMVVPSIVIYLQFAIFDRAPAGLGWMLGSAIMLALTVTALGMERNKDAGRARDLEGRPMPRRSGAAAVVMAGLVGVLAIVTANGAAGAISEYGNVPWRSGGSGYGVGGGGIAYDRFVDLRQRLLSPTNAIVFRATVAEGSPPPEQIYWRMESLDEFDGTGWGRSSTSIRNYEPGQTIGAPDHRYQGTTADVPQRIRIEELRGEVMPTAGIAAAVLAIDAGSAIDPRSVKVATDSSLIYTPRLRPGDEYQLVGTYPLQKQDLGAMATGAFGRLSPMFAGAADAGLFNEVPSLDREDIAEPNDLSFYLELPDSLPAAIRGTALLETRGAFTDFEKAWMLQYWFRDSGDFTYSLDVTTGHDALALEDWLSDSTSLNYRIGYCQQFATSMAVLGRVLGIPSRVVWGFTPGTVMADGSIEVRDKNAHSWVEMWIDGFGWVRFDPTPRSDSLPTSITAGFDPTNFVPGDDANAFEQAPSLLIPESGDLAGIIDQPPVEATTGGLRWWILALPVIALLAGVIPLLKSLRRRHRLKTIRNGDITAAWDEIVDQLTDLGETVHPSKTPMEFAAETDPALLSLAVSYSAAIYGGRTGDAKESDLLEVEGWILRRYDGMTRAKAAISTRSLIGRR
ncbi:MAG: DUF3488 and transglutaminase-like domain-containing protein [Acidimicrobiia bacterium]